MSSLFGSKGSSTSSNISSTGSNTATNSVSNLQPIYLNGSISNNNSIFPNNYTGGSDSQSTQTPLDNSSPENQLSFATPQLEGKLSTGSLVIGAVLLIIIIFYFMVKK